MIAIQGLGFCFPDSQQDTLHDVNLEIAPGEFVVIAGPSGCGKSTLALAIGGYLFHQYNGESRGIVRVDGIDARQSPIYDLAELVGLVQQNPEAQFCTLTVRDEIAFGLENRRLPPSTIQERLDWALSIVGAGHLQDRLLATLSGGEKQKVAIAAMMAAKPQVLIFDEPTSNLDPSATAEIFGVIEHIRAKAGITVIVIEHKLDYLRAFDPRLVVMWEGSIRYDGPAAAEQDYTQMNFKPALPPLGPIEEEPSVRVKNLQSGYNGQPVLRDISLDFYPGELVAIMGDNGSGKSTFLKCLLGLHTPDQGEVEVLGQDIRRVPTSQVARKVGFCFQNPDHQLFAESVWQEAVFASKNFDLFDESTRVRVDTLLRRCGLGGREQEHPYRLSYGEKRRLNLISALAHSPPLVLLDEILIGQDPANAAFLMDLLRKRAEQGGTVVMAIHAPEIVRRYASRLLFFDRGQITVDAPTEEGFRQLAAQGRHAYLPASGFGWQRAQVGTPGVVSSDQRTGS
jgi:energy-coupling factor transport system ATP-binding protein